MRLLLILLAFCTTVTASEAPPEEILNLHRIDARLVTAGQVFGPHITKMKNQGVEVIINLAVADPERNHDEGFLVAGQGIDYLNIPVVWEQPTQQNLDLFLSVMEASADRHVLVHCFANYRASAFTYLYRVLKGGVSQNVAEADLRAVWSDEAFEENPQWRIFIDQQLSTTTK